MGGRKGRWREVREMRREIVKVIGKEERRKGRRRKKGQVVRGKRGMKEGDDGRIMKEIEGFGSRMKNRKEEEIVEGKREKWRERKE